ncbi:hypothetical protein [Arcobacter aquimarinus]|uniref:Divalent metal cation transporter n=1 Tax=Arcobacter aquimarinus TaxID=1315211 RepID=A0AAE7B4T9_9BACT|nr:hypothetical protein [Arcobacter aquimarinus]QKE25759.1 divalent metal cation transporter [Arcobacter aquimarinus]RXI35194.1 hypothetical protein CP986_07535 [Arcobacter aquimarinus]
MKKIKDILIFGTFGWGVSFGIIFALHRYYIDNITTPPFGSYIVFSILCLVAGTLFGYFTSKIKKDENI